jgi:hypothetical protein
MTKNDNKKTVNELWEEHAETLGPVAYETCRGIYYTIKGALVAVFLLPVRLMKKDTGSKDEQ